MRPGAGRPAGASKRRPIDPIWDFVHPEDAATTREAIERLSHLERTEVEFRLRAKAGAWLWMRAHLVRGDEDWVLAILRDITAERQREDDSGEARHAAGMLATTAGVTVWRYNPDTDKYTIDPDFTRSERARVAERKAGGDLVRSTVHKADAPALQQAWEHTLSTGEAGMMSYRELTPAGRGDTCASPGGACASSPPAAGRFLASPRTSPNLSPRAMRPWPASGKPAPPRPPSRSSSPMSATRSARR
jgi:hypothetical protein